MHFFCLSILLSLFIKLFWNNFSCLFHFPETCLRLEKLVREMQLLKQKEIGNVDSFDESGFLDTLSCLHKLELVEEKCELELEQEFCGY